MSKSKILIIVFSSLVMIVTSLLSEGYYHTDEHYQILEFANIHFESNDYEKLAWEYDAQIRPSLQVYVALGVMKIGRFFGLESPHVYAAFLRLLTSVLSAIALFCVWRVMSPQVAKKEQALFLTALSCLLWFMPVLLCRFSSEIWSGIFLVFGVCFLMNTSNRIRSYVISGVFLALCFSFRYQMGISIAGIFIWLFWKKRAERRQMLFLVLSFLGVCFSSFVLDSHFYGEWTLVPWNYFEVNILDDVSSNFGTDPAYYYALQLAKSCIIPIGLLIISSLFYFSFHNRSHIINWIVWPFIFFHMLIPHKELRFLFPLIFFLPVVLYWSLMKWKELYKNAFFRVSTVALIMMNLGALLVSGLTPLGKGLIPLAHEIDRNSDKEERVELYFTEGLNPYDPLGGLYANFYIERELGHNEFEKDSMSHMLPHPDHNSFLIIQNSELENYDTSDWVIKKHSVYPWLLNVFKIYKGSKYSYPVLLQKR